MTMRSTLTVGLVLIVSSVALGASPRTRSLRPAGGQRGTEVEVSLSGRRMGDAKEILFYQPGIVATNLKVVNDNEIKATFKIAADSPLGLHDLRLRTASGLSEMRSFSVGVLKDVAEVEPNSDFATPQRIALGTTVNGVADNEDVDYYVVEAKKGERIGAEVEGIRLGNTFFDPYVAILDTKRFELAVSDDASLVWQDAFASIVAPEDGSYIILVRDSAYAGNSQCVYRLHVGSFPRPSTVYPAGGKLGEKVALRWIGDVLGETRSSVTLPDHPVIDFGIYAQDERGIATYPNLFRLSSFGNVLESEPNNDTTTATPFAAPLACNGVIDRPGDVDHFVFSARKGDRYEVKVFARALRSPLDAVLSITQRKGGAIGRSDDANGSPDSALQFNAPADGEYVIAIQDHLLKGGPDYAYRIELGPVEPQLTLSVPNESLYQGRNAPVAVNVPQGGFGAILVNATRTGFSGELAIETLGLPAGVTVEADPMAAALGSYPVLFHASADAPLAGSLAYFAGKPTDPKVNVPCRFQHANELVTGQNNAPFWTRTTDRFAVAVTEEAPFSIEVIEPKVPLVRSGSMDLKVVAHRKSGFKTPIAVALLWNPPGIGSSGSVTIPEGQDEALIPLNASDAAELKTWRTVVVGTAEVPNPIDGPPPEPRPGNRGGNRLGTITVASPMTRIAVAEKFVSFELQAATVEQGKETDLVVKVTRLADFADEAQVTLLGLPNKVTTDPKTITKETEELVFHLKTDKVSPAGNHPNLVCRAVIQKDGEPIVHNLGPGKLRIDVPIPPKPATAANKPAAAATAAPVAVTPNSKPSEGAAKPVSRLEQLRRERQQAAQSGGGGSGNEK
jgi:hypothetical protein